MKAVFNVLFAFAFSLMSAGDGHKHQELSIKFEENRNQWPGQVHYKTDIPGASIFFEKNAITYALYSLEDLDKAHEFAHQNNNSALKAPQPVRMHAFKATFINADPFATITAGGQLPEYHNYLRGNDPATWASFVQLYKEIRYNNIYPGIDIRIYSSGGNLKYDYLVGTGNPSDILIRYVGVNGLSLRNGILVIPTNTGEFLEEKPVAWQEQNGKKKFVSCKYVLKGNELSFEFPSGYDPNLPLIIDPILVASTYSGSTMTNYGHCATYDAAGNIYTGAISFGTGYPVTTGAFQTNFGGSIDIAISKLDATGSNLLYATYIGGSMGDYPHSLFVDGSNNLFVFGISGGNYPTSPGCYDNTFNGGTDDIVISKLDPTGGTLIGSTYVGGSSDDGTNMLSFAYGDTYRGEIIADAAGNPYVASASSSPNFPTTPGAYDQTLNGSQDAVFFKMNPTLTAMTWSTFLGGSVEDAGYGLRLDANGDLFVVGGTSSNNFPTTGGVLNPAFVGTTDGFVAHLSNNGSTLSRSTFFGSAQFDEVFFVDLDLNGDVYIYGVTSGNIPTTPGVYSNPGSGQFVTKLNPALNAVIYSTLFGNGTPNQFGDFSPTAFMVDICENVYMAGWGSTNSYPVSTNALQPNTDGSDFYLIVIAKDALSLIYATYFGDLQSWEHVDGGTSRFDPNGIVYEAICEGGFGLTTTTGAYSPTNQAGSWDVAVFKIDFQSVGVNAQAQAAPADTICINGTVTFSNGSLNAVNYIWDFGDGSPVDTNAAPSHTYTNTGVYTVTLIAIDSASCNFSDTFTLQITVIPEPLAALGNDTAICGTINMVLNPGNNPGCTFLWSTGATTQTINVASAGTFWVTVDNGYCTKTDSIVISQFTPTSLGSDTAICQGQTVMLDAGNPGSNYAWSTGATTQTIIVSTAGTYWVTVSSGTCASTDTIQVIVNPLPVVNLGSDITLCPGDNQLLDAGNPGATYAWSTGQNTQTITVNTAGIYAVTVTNGNCSASDSIQISIAPLTNLGTDVTICASTSVVLDAGAGHGSYTWSTGATTQTITVNEDGVYWVETGTGNCTRRDSITVSGASNSGMVFMPNCFTPDQNNLNERFRGEGVGIVYFNMKIFNRWGELYFETNDFVSGWDGRYEGEIVQEDVYVYKIEYRSECDEQKLITKIGHVLVLR